MVTLNRYPTASPSILSCNASILQIWREGLPSKRLLSATPPSSTPLLSPSPSPFFPLRTPTPCTTCHRADSLTCHSLSLHLAPPHHASPHPTLPCPAPPHPALTSTVEELFPQEATPVYLAEVAPPRWRGAFTGGFPFFLGLGIVITNLTNYGTNHISHWGWRLSLGLASAPAAIIVLGAFLITDSPSSLVVRGKLDAARAALHRIRGPNADIDAEFKHIMRSVEESKKNEEEAYKRILRREYRPHLVMAVAVALFFQLTGVIVLAFFSPLLFRTVGFGSNASLMGAVILGAAKLGSTVMSIFTIDRLGRRRLFFIGGFVMVVCQVAVASIMGTKLGNGKGGMPHGYAMAVLVLVCGHAAGFGVSWSPLNWIIQGEIFPVEVRSAGVGISNAIGLGMTFLQSQTFLAMLCTFKYATFAYYAGWIVVMTTFVALFLPETKGVPLESMNVVWERHWYWCRFVREKNQVVDESA